MADADNWGGVPVTSQPASDDWGGVPVSQQAQPTKFPDTAPIQKMVTDNLAKQPSPTEGEVPQTGVQNLDIGTGLPLSTGLKGGINELPADYREQLIQAYKNGTATSAGDYMQSVLPTAAASVDPANHYAQLVGRIGLQTATWLNPYTIGAHLFDIPLHVGAIGAQLIQQNLSPDNIFSIPKGSPYNAPPTFGALFDKIGETLFPQGATQNNIEELASTAATFAGAGAITKAPSLALRAWNSFTGAALGAGGEFSQQKAEEWAKQNFPDNQVLQNGISQAAGLLAMVGVGGVLHAAGHAALKPSIADIVGKPPEAVTPQDTNQVIDKAFENSAPKAQDFHDVAAVMDSQNGQAPRVNNGVHPDQVNTPESQKSWLNDRAGRFDKMAQDAEESGDTEKANNARGLSQQNRDQANSINVGAIGEDFSSPHMTSIDITPEPKLPKDLAGAKTNYGYQQKQFQVSFDSDIDRAMYIAAQKTPSARDADYRSFLKNQGYTDAEITQHGQAIRDKIKGIAKDADPGQIKIERTTPSAKGLEKSAPKAPPISNDVSNSIDTASTLQEIYKQTGVRPDQVFEDAKNDPTLAAQVRNGKIPDAYEHLIPVPEAKTEEGGQGNKPPSGPEGPEPPPIEDPNAPPPEPEKPQSKLAQAIKAIRDAFSPTSAGGKAKETEAAMRGAYGEAKRDQAIAESKFNDFARQADGMTAEDHDDFYNYVEGRSKGATLKNKAFQGLADAVKGVYEQFKSILQDMPENKTMSFIEDYFTHQWKDGQEEKIKQFLDSWAKQGSSRNLKQRTIPTIAEGLQYGLELKEPNPVRAVSRYVASMSNYIASVEALRAITTDLGGGYYASGKEPDGYAPMVGRNAERIEDAYIDPESGKLVPAKKMQLYAPSEVANLYNVFHSKGFEDTSLKPAYELIRGAINANTMLELGLSAYHYSTINMQSLNQDVGRIFKNVIMGDWQGVVNAIQGLITPGLHAYQGTQLLNQYKGLADHGIDMERTAQLFAKANLRAGIDPLSNTATHGGFFKAWQRGELPEVMDRLKSQLTEGYGVGALKSGAEALSRVVSDVAHPLFNAYIPAIKMSAFHDLMGDWLRQNPNATDAEVHQAAIFNADRAESRFGEMNMENVFWDKKVKELLGLGFRAPGWDLGLIDQAMGPASDIYHMIKDAKSGEKFNPQRLDRLCYLAGMATVYAATNAALTYIHTGKTPDSKDLIAFATGGQHKSFGLHPERGELPGHGRELLQLAPIPGEGPLSGVAQEISNKTTSLPKNILESALAKPDKHGVYKDSFGKVVYDPNGKGLQSVPGVAQAAYVGEKFAPFQMEQLFDGQPAGSKLSLAERFLGVRAAGAKIVAPKELEKFNEKHNR